MEKFARRCDATGKGINEGYVVGDGELCFGNEEDLLYHLRELNWEDSNGVKSKDLEVDQLLEYFYNENYYYYTEWDMYDIDDEWYDAEGNEYNN